MGRGKNGRRRASVDSAPVGLSSSSFNGNKAAPGMPLLPDNELASRQEVMDAIDFHWKNLSLDLKRFLLDNPSELSLRKFVDYWTHPSRTDLTSPNIAASVCGCSWYLALNYMSVGKVVEARALILNGCFLQQCYNKPIEEIAEIATSISGSSFRTQLPFFTDGLLAISTEERMSTFLKNKVSSDYQRRMSFATQTTKSKKKVQDYVNQISSDWDMGRGMTEVKKEKRRRASLDALPADSFIEIKLVDSRTKEETSMRYGLSMNLKNLFKKYAEDRSLNLRQLRFSYEGRTLFLSSVGSKTPQDLGIKHLDSIFVTNNASCTEEESSSSSDESKESAKPQDRSKQDGGDRRKNTKSRKQHRRASWAGPELIGEEERLKLQHSRQLSRVFAEVAPRFEEMRRKLNVLDLQCTPPKVKRGRKKPVAIEPPPLACNPDGGGVGGKAGVPFYAVNVGEPDNLYKITKPLQAKSLSIDLHGMTKQEALDELDRILPEWVDLAMRGSYPWVIPAVIVCGGGNQILSEAVEGWIRGNDNVAKAPKRKFSRRRTM